MKQAHLYSLYAGAALHLGWAIFHLFFPRVFKWKESLAGLDIVNRNVYQILNICLTFYFVAAAYLSAFYAADLLTTDLGRKLTALFAAFWMLRFGLQLRFFKPAHPVALLLNVLFLITFAAYAYPLMQGTH